MAKLNYKHAKAGFSTLEVTTFSEWIDAMRIISTEANQIKHNYVADPVAETTPKAVTLKLEPGADIIALHKHRILTHVSNGKYADAKALTLGLLNSVIGSFVRKNADDDLTAKLRDGFMDVLMSINAELNKAGHPEEAYNLCGSVFEVLTTTIRSRESELTNTMFEALNNSNTVRAHQNLISLEEVTEISSKLAKLFPKMKELEEAVTAEVDEKARRDLNKQLAPLILESTPLKERYMAYNIQLSESEAAISAVAKVLYIEYARFDDSLNERSLRRSIGALRKTDQAAAADLLEHLISESRLAETAELVKKTIGNKLSYTDPLERIMLITGQEANRYYSPSLGNINHSALHLPEGNYGITANLRPVGIQSNPENVLLHVNHKPSGYSVAINIGAESTAEHVAACEMDLRKTPNKSRKLGDDEAKKFHAHIIGVPSDIETALAAYAEVCGNTELTDAEFDEKKKEIKDATTVSQAVTIRNFYKALKVCADRSSYIAGTHIGKPLPQAYIVTAGENPSIVRGVAGVRHNLSQLRINNNGILNEDKPEPGQLQAEIDGLSFLRNRIFPLSSTIKRTGSELIMNEYARPRYTSPVLITRLTEYMVDSIYYTHTAGERAGFYFDAGVPAADAAREYLGYAAFKAYIGNSKVTHMTMGVLAILGNAIGKELGLGPEEELGEDDLSPETHAAIRHALYDSYIPLITGSSQLTVELLGTLINPVISDTSGKAFLLRLPDGQVTIDQAHIQEVENKMRIQFSDRFTPRGKISLDGEQPLQVEPSKPFKVVAATKHTLHATLEANPPTTVKAPATSSITTPPTARPKIMAGPLYTGGKTN